jgi:hypothetical protein
MKTLILVFCIAFGGLIFKTSRLNAQIPSVACIVNSVDFYKDTIAEWKLFSGRNLEGKTYLHWNVANQHTDGVYIIYRSLDGEHYTPAGQKSGIGVPVSIDIAYYFIDNFSSNSTVYYKLLHISKMNTYVLSDVINIPVDPKSLYIATK